jgi:hypothetical protein
MPTELEMAAPIRVAAPSIDAVALIDAVRERAPGFEGTRAAKRAGTSLRARFLREALDDIERRAGTFMHLSAPLDAVPPRWRRAGRLAPLLVRAYNYLFKRSYEAAAEQTQIVIAALELIRLLHDDAEGADDV